VIGAMDAVLSECQRLAFLGVRFTQHLGAEPEALQLKEFARVHHAFKALSKDDPSYEGARDHLGISYGQAYHAFDSLKRAGKIKGVYVAFAPPEALLPDVFSSPALLAESGSRAPAAMSPSASFSFEAVPLVQTAHAVDGTDGAADVEEDAEDLEEDEADTEEDEADTRPSGG
jgi:hypothetical protein